MIKNHLIIAWRAFVRTRSTSIISITGLSSGIAVALLIGIWIIDEVSFNKSFNNYDRIAQVYHQVTFGDEELTISDVPAPLGETLRGSVVELDQVAMSSYAREHVLSFENKNLSKTGRFVDAQFIEIFSVRFLHGTERFDEKNSVMLSNTFAAALLGDDPVGKVVKFDDRDLLTVVGVFEDFPSNSEFKGLDMLMPLAQYFGRDESTAKKEHNWEEYTFECFATLRDERLLERAEEKMKSILFDHASGDGKTLKPAGLLFPMKKWHLHADFDDGVHSGGQVRFVWMFGIIAVFVLFLACINFINLSTARAEKRSREVGVRKVLGSKRSQLTWQFFTESAVFTLISFVLATILCALVLPWFNELAGKEMSFQLMLRSEFLLVCFALLLITALLAGTYPAMYLASFSPAKVLKGTFKAGRSAAIPRKILVVFQFTTSIILIVGMLVVFQQIKHAKDRPVGFDREGIIHLPVRTQGLAHADYNSLRRELLATGVVENMAASDFPVTGTMSADASLRWEGKDPTSQPLVAMNSCSHDFPRANGFQFVAGRDFSRDHASDSMGVIVNELAAELMGREDIIGKEITFGYGTPRKIIGVIKDQVRWTPFVKQSPHIYFINYQAIGSITVRFAKGANIHDALQQVQSVIKKFDDAAPFNYEFLDDDYAGMFKQEERIGTLTTVFSSLAVLISCIGLFGLASFATVQRSREIGIRKALGASVFVVWKMMLGDFLQLVVVAIGIGIPLAWYLTAQWLGQYEYRTDLSWLIFVLTGMSVIVLTIVTVSFQTLRAALANPVHALKSE